MTLSQKISTQSAQENDLLVGHTTLAQEQEGLRILSQSLDATFSKALDIIQHVKGRVIVSGMGKSGHVARKIAATFASTGTPSFFVHPAEASHGDLGMITPNDCVIALSNSGKTRELVDILEFTVRVGIPLIAITQNEESTLAQSANLTLLIPRVREACPNGLAPTTSTTMMMALGDALAVSLLTRRGFSSTDFRLFHPGGELGRKLLKVQDLMHHGETLPLVASGTLMKQVLHVISEKKFGCVGVIDENDQLMGIVTDGDIRRHICSEFLDLPVENVMTPDPQTLDPEALAVEALARMQDKAITAIFVLDTNKKPLGILNIHDCLRAGLI
jgi:arabinose-5-phosphate isomerase